MKLRLYSALGDSKLICDLGMLISFDFMKNERDPRTFRQRCDCVLQIHSCVNLVLRCSSLVPWIFHEEYPRASPFIRAHSLQKRIHSEAMKPR